MKVVKKILFVLLGLIALLLVVALFVPKAFKSERQIVINKPRQEVFNYLKYVKNQDNFGVWQKADPEMKTSSEGTDGQVGFKYSWDGEKVGKGSQTITKIVEGERIETELDFGFGDPAAAFFIVKDAGTDQTSVTWGITGRSPWPLNLMGLFFDVGKDFEKGLQHLKVVLEK
ncbi:SRPBCC family protein [Agriterribacter sp.]|uniref:SRPBCC family protein n=1 Tax=Agriterribacter sp. TaxID=2821509 RepID=UPI002C0948BA|nr:SRPBCC family protein [Agriterribacter sp.]HRO45431.1 SRPBCC family protein [Agriterribacter sp.]HRQ19139.1 SRPBCC family protein [Agriterribacter sp.]